MCQSCVEDGQISAWLLDVIDTFIDRYEVDSPEYGFGHIVLADKEKINKRNKIYRDTHKKEQSLRARSSHEAKQAIVHFALIFIKDSPCQDCNKIFPPECMDFDHVRGRKIFNVSSGECTHRTLETMLKEIAKCELVCANCHRIRTGKRMGGYYADFRA